MIRGLVLAGGKSSRFGRDKALESFQGGKTLLDISIDLVKSAGLEPVVVTRQDTSRSISDGIVIHDKLLDRGPLGGIHSAQIEFPETDFLVLTCDMPWVSLETLFHLLQHPQRSADVCIYQVAGCDQPFPGLYRHTSHQVLLERLSSNDRSMRGFLSAVNCERLMWEGDPKVFGNVNRPTDV